MTVEKVVQGATFSSFVTNESSPFNRPRTIGGLLLLFTGSGLLVIDAFSETYAADTITLALCFGTASILLGVESIRRYLGGPDD